MDYAEYARLFKALSDPKRLKIVHMLAGGELDAFLRHFSLAALLEKRIDKILYETYNANIEKNLYVKGDM